VAVPFYERALGVFARLTNLFRVWYRYPFLIAMPTLVGHRVNMRANNLLDTERDPSLVPFQPNLNPRDQREADGGYNDLACPWMGKAGARFGRNMPIAETYGEAPPELYEPNPRLISRALLARKEFAAVPYLNVLVPAWLQFMVHDWLSHGPSRKNDPHLLTLPPDDDWPNTDGKMAILRSAPDPLRAPADEGQPATYRNIETHWWDGSQIYGSSLEKQRRVRGANAPGDTMRADGKIALDANGLLPLDADEQGPNDTPGLELAGVNGSWWLGLSVMQTIFAREHNAIVDALRVEYPEADGEWLFQKARLVNAALIAKIHTTEWTPALMNSPEGRFAMRGNFWGVLGEHYARAYGRLGDGEILSGIPGSPTDHHGAPYAMTEEFTAVYRMHSLLPDAFSLRRATDDVELANRNFTAVAGGRVHGVYADVPFADVLYSLATSNPGALQLHNYPAGLRKLVKEDSPHNNVTIDLASVDILRDRERGVPRYCDFRRGLGMRVPKSFADLTDNTKWQEELEAVYGSVEKVDLLVGMHCEKAPPGFGFSDTAFRIFILMASRRLKSDRFFTVDFTPEVYTPVGFEWIRDNNFRSVLERHFPALRPRFANLRNVFFPWDRPGH
jgi:Animal haem peroxidase